MPIFSVLGAIARNGKTRRGQCRTAHIGIEQPSQCLSTLDNISGIQHIAYAVIGSGTMIQNCY